MLLALGVALPSFAGEARPYDVAPFESWVRVLDLPAPPASNEKDDSGTVYLLSDEQVRVSAKDEVSRFIRFARHFRTASSVEQGAQIFITFDPAYEQLVLHGVWRHRAGVKASILEHAEVKVIQKEQDLGRNLIDGRLTATVFARDIRVGDTLEYAYTVHGSNPVFQGAFAHGFTAGYAVPVSRWHRRVLWESGRKLIIENHGNVSSGVSRTGSSPQELIWSAENLQPLQYDDATPIWFDETPWIQLSTSPDWSSVVEWALKLFTVTGTSDALEREVKRIQAEHVEGADRFRAALTFVQNEVRYLGMELGPHSHRPHSPALVLERRFGDCKDKALLLVTMLRRLGLEAEPALVNTTLRRSLDAWRPTHAAFDHVIVRARLDGKTWWVDPTRVDEHGPLESLQPPPFERALVVAPGQSALTTIPSRELTEASIVVDEHFVGTDGSSPGTLTVTTTYRGQRAERARQRLERSPPKEFARELLNFYAHTDPDIRSTKDLEIGDDRAANVLTLVEHYALPRFHNGERRDVKAHLILSSLEEPTIYQRTAPFAVSHPVHLVHRIRLTTPGGVEVTPERDTKTGPAATFTWSSKTQGDDLLLEYEYVSTADFVGAADIQKHRKFVTEVRDNIGYWVDLNGAPQRSMRRGSGSILGLLSTLGFVALAVVLIFVWTPRRIWHAVRLRRRRSKFSAKFKEAEGESASSALALASTQDLPLACAGLRCACGRRGLEVIRHEPVVLGGTACLVARTRCPACSAERSVYFQPPGIKGGVARATEPPARVSHPEHGEPERACSLCLPHVVRQHRNG